jgi:HK97 family phage portal protein
VGKKKRRALAVPDAETFDASPSYSIGDPAFADFLRMSGVAWGGDLNESHALGLTAFYRAVALISGTIAGLPLKVYRSLGDGGREEVPHFLSDTPAGPYDLSAFSWCEMVMLHQLLHAETFLKSVENEGGELIGLWPIHPLAVTKVAWDGADKVFDVAMSNGQKETLVTGEVTQILGMSTDGLRGMSPLSVFRNSLNTSRAGETAANRTFSTGALISGLVTTEEDVDGDEAKLIKESLNAKMQGAENAGSIAFVNRSLKFSPWKMNNVDAQFLESRRFQVEEIARMFGIPTSLLSVSGAVSNWGTGVAESVLAMQRFVLMGYTSRIESGLRAILPPDHFAEFDYKGLLQGSPQQEIELLIAQVTAGILTKDEARAIMNRPPLPEEPPEPEPPALPPQEDTET